jgi:hypothetical protein
MSSQTIKVALGVALYLLLAPKVQQLTNLQVAM